MATGLPCIVNKHPNLEWMIGEGGASIDMSKEGELATILEKLHSQEGREGAERRESLTRMGGTARRRAEETFSEEAVVPQIIQMYREVLGRNK